jgi:hypothetical protein
MSAVIRVSIRDSISDAGLDIALCRRALAIDLGCPELSHLEEPLVDRVVARRRAWRWFCRERWIWCAYFR